MSIVNSKLQMNFKPTRDPANSLSNLEEVALLEYNYNDSVLEIEFKASVQEPIYLLEVGHIVLTAFSGGTPAIDVGDGTTSDKYIGSASVTEGTAGNRVVSAVGAKLTARGVVKVTLSASLAAGKGLLFCKFVRGA